MGGFPDLWRMFLGAIITGNEALKAIGSAAAKGAFPKLEVLDCPCTCMREEAKGFAGSLLAGGAFPELKDLIFQGRGRGGRHYSRIAASGVDALLEAIAEGTLPKLQTCLDDPNELRNGRVGVGTAGLAALSNKNLASPSCTLVDIQLVEMGVDDACAAALAEGLSTKDCAPLLALIKLTENRIGVDGATALLKAIEKRGDVYRPKDKAAGRRHAVCLRFEVRNNPFCKWASIEESRAFRAQVAEQAAWAFSGDNVADHVAMGAGRRRRSWRRSRRGRTRAGACPMESSGTDRSDGDGCVERWAHV